MVAVDLALVMANDTDGSGQPLFVVRTFKKVRTDAANADIYAVAQALLGLIAADTLEYHVRLSDPPQITTPGQVSRCQLLDLIPEHNFLS
jgi:hypothetical protein